MSLCSTTRSPCVTGEQMRWEQLEPYDITTSAFSRPYESSYAIAAPANSASSCRRA